MSGRLINAAINRNRTVLSVLVLILIVGLGAYRSIPKEANPDIDIPMIYVSMALEGVSPDDAERLLLRPMEQELSSIEGLDELKSTAYQGGGFVLLEFQAGFDKDKALDDVQKGVDHARPDLPDDVEEPEVTEVNFSLFPVLVVTLSGDVPERSLLRLARDLQEKLEGIPSILEANIAGDREEVVEILIDSKALESYALDGGAIIQFFQRSNRLVAAGNLDTGAGRFAIEVPGLFESVTDLYDMPVRAEGDSAIKLKDIAEIRRTFKDPENFARLNGQRAIALEIVKRSGENVIETVEAVKKMVAEERAYWPEGVDVSFSQDQSKNIRTMLSDLQNNMISAVLLVMIVVVAALGVRAAGLVGVAIPGAFLSGIMVLSLMGLTVNVVVLFSLILSVGMLVDGAIVVTEYADRKMIEGLPRKEAYAAAATRMAWPIIASTATTLAAFAPLLFWPDTVGEFMKFMPITMIAVLASSLLMALIFVPTLGSLIGAPDKSHKKIDLSAMGSRDLLSLPGFTGFYVRVLDHALNHAGKILLLAVFLLVGVQVAYGKFGKGVEFFPDIEPEIASVLIHARGNLSVYEKDELVREVESRILDMDGIETFYTRSGKAAGSGSELAEDVIGQIQVEFTEWNTRRPANEILSDIEARTADMAGIFVETAKMEEGPPTGKAVQIEISSRFPDAIPPAVTLVRGVLTDLGDFIDVEDTLPLPGVRWELDVDRAQAAKFGMDISTIGNYIRLVTNGLKVAEYRPDDSHDEIDIVLRHKREERTLDQLDRIRIESSDGSVPISNFVRRTAEPAVGTINRVDQKRVVTVKADLPPGINTAAKVDQIKQWLADNADKIDPRLDIKFRGEDEEQRESQSFLIKAFGIALFMMAVILVTQFNSFYQAFLILSAVIMSTIGVMLGLLITGQPFGIIMSGIGVIALAGIIVNNNIVLIDTFDVLHKKLHDQMSVKELVLRTGAQRLRPVLLTTITTILGLLPMVFQLNIDFASREISHGAPSTQWWVQLATAIAFGLSFSTLLTLVVTPCALVFKETASSIFTKIMVKSKTWISKNKTTHG
ncbi:MAG: efflux RND transporter permease subunit [Rhodospirillales bacterium]|nr:efflux RND transporter permease subunit [Rhodospirillales bacterium]